MPTGIIRQSPFGMNRCLTVDVVFHKCLGYYKHNINKKERCVLKPGYHLSFPFIFSFPICGASCRIRTNDPEITNHVLWPTELKRRVGKLLTSRRYNQLPLLRSRPGGFEGS